VISAQVNAQTFEEKTTPEASALSKVLYAKDVEHDSGWRTSLADTLHRYCESVLVQVPQNTPQEDQWVDKEFHDALADKIAPNLNFERWNERMQRHRERLNRFFSSAEYARKKIREVVSKCSSLTNDLIKRKPTSPVAEALMWTQLSQYFMAEDEFWRLTQIIGLVSPNHCSHPNAVEFLKDDPLSKVDPPGAHDENEICSFWGFANAAIINYAVIPLLQASTSR
jgi:hypothetical protein